MDGLTDKIPPLFLHPLRFIAQPPSFGVGGTSDQWVQSSSLALAAFVTLQRIIRKQNSLKVHLKWYKRASLTQKKGQFDANKEFRVSLTQNI